MQTTDYQIEIGTWNHKNAHKSLVLGLFEIYNCMEIICIR